jgi:hypothetical protein
LFPYLQGMGQEFPLWKSGALGLLHFISIRMDTGIKQELSKLVHPFRLAARKAAENKTNIGSVFEYDYRRKDLNVKHRYSY